MIEGRQRLGGSKPITDTPRPAVMPSPYVAYSSRAKEFVKATRTLDMLELYDEFLPYVDERGTILDIGAGSGRDSKEFIKRGLTVVALEPDEELAKLASEYIGQPVVRETIQKYVPENGERFNGIWASASLLHIPPQELTKVFCRLSYIMKPDGALYMSFKYGPEAIKEKGGLYYTYLDEESFDKHLLKTLFRYQKVWVTEDRREDRKGERWLNVIVRSTGVDGPFDAFWKSIGRRR